MNPVLRSAVLLLLLLLLQLQLPHPLLQLLHHLMLPFLLLLRAQSLPRKQPLPWLQLLEYEL